MKSFGNLRSRVLLIIVVAVIAVGGAIAYLGYQRTKQQTVASATLLGAPGQIKSIPGVGKATPQFVKKIQEADVQKVQEAIKKGKAALPTLVRPGFTGNGVFAGGQASSPDCQPDALKRALASGVRADELRCARCTAQELCSAGYTAGDLVDAGFSAKQLANTTCYTVAALRAAGFTATELQRAGYTCTQLLTAGYSPAAISKAGYSQTQLQACLSPQILAQLKADLPREFPEKL